MPIDPTKPLDSVPAEKSDLRANLQAAKDGIEAGIITDATTSIAIDADAFGDRQYIRILCTASGAITVTLEDDVPVGKLVELVRRGSGNITVQGGNGVTLSPTAGSGNWPEDLHLTTDLHEALAYTVDEGVEGTEWRQVARPTPPQA